MPSATWGSIAFRLVALFPEAESHALGNSVPCLTGHQFDADRVSGAAPPAPTLQPFVGYAGRFRILGMKQGVLILLNTCRHACQTQLEEPAAVIGATEYFDVEAGIGRIVLTPVRIQRGDAMRAKLAELGLQEQDTADAVAWARQAAAGKPARKN